jgi:Tol biopolymer transport system component
MRLSAIFELAAWVAISTNAGAAEAFFSQGKILFVSTQSGNAQIYVMNADGSDQRALTSGREENTQPAWSPNGRRIAYTSVGERGNMEIYVMDADGSNKRRLTDHARPDDAPAWSPDGKQIVFRSYRDRHANLYVMDADGGNLRRLTDNALDKGKPLWSPDGSRIAYSVIGDFGNIQLHIIRADGSEDRDVSSAVSKHKKTQPAWSPDGSKLAFVSMTSYLENDIYVVNADGSNPVNLTGNAYANTMPAWSPDGKRIAFVSNRYGGKVGRSEGDIYVMNADGSNPINLTRQPGNDDEPSWSTDGKILYFLSLRDGPSHLYALQLDGGPASRMTSHSSHDLMFSLSAAGPSSGKGSASNLTVAGTPSSGY